MNNRDPLEEIIKKVQNQNFDLLTQNDSLRKENEQLKALVSKCKKALHEDYEWHCENCIQICGIDVCCSIKYKGLIKKLEEINVTKI